MRRCGLAERRGSRFAPTLREGERVTPLELFFDLVFVLAITQCTALMSHHPTWSGLAQGLLVLGMLWWAWVGYAWLTSVIDPEEGAVRLVIFGGDGGAADRLALRARGLRRASASPSRSPTASSGSPTSRLFMLASPDDDALRHSVLGLAASTAIAVAPAGRSPRSSTASPRARSGRWRSSSTWPAPTSSAPRAGNWSPATSPSATG